MAKTQKNLAGMSAFFEDAPELALRKQCATKARNWDGAEPFRFVDTRACAPRVLSAIAAELARRGVNAAVTDTGRAGVVMTVSSRGVIHDTAAWTAAYAAADKAAADKAAAK